MFAQKHRFRIFALIMSAILAFLMTGVISFISTGLDTGFLLLGSSVRTIAERLCTRDG
jgi:Protein of unknown function (DUF2798)